MLEERLKNVASITPQAEWQIDILRSVLRGEVGTEAQRNALIRIISQNQIDPKELPVRNMHRLINVPAPTRSTYY